MIRAFIAIDFPTPIRQKIKQLSDELQTQTPPDALKWVSAENMHLTLRFLGELPEPTINEIKTRLKNSPFAVPPFKISFKGLGMYPNIRQPRVIWLGITNTEPLRQIYRDIQQSLESINVPPDNKPFSPHLTLARLRRHVTKEQAQQVGNRLSQFKVGEIGPCTIQAIHLYQSQLTGQGPIYTPLLTMPLNTV